MTWWALAALAFLTVSVTGWLTVTMTRAVRAARHHRAVATAALADVDALLMAALDLRGVDEVADAGNKICRIATELLRGDGAVLSVQGPTRLLVAGHFGNHVSTRQDEAGPDPDLEEVLRSGAVRAGEPVVVPVTGNGGVFGVLAVSGSRRPLDDLGLGMLQVFGSQAGAVLDRIGAVDSLFDAVTRDPVSGVANRLHASTLIASLRPGDGLLLIEIDGLDEARRTGGVDAANVLLGQAGLHLRHGIRAGDAVARFADNQFVVVLRSLKIPIERVGTRLLDTWRHGQAGRTISVGAALHLDGDMPLDTLDRADSAVTSARSRGDEVHVASVWARPAPSPARLRTPAA